MAVSARCRRMFADVLSVLSMTMGKQDERECLQYKFQGNLTDIEEWGSEYVSHLSGEVASEYKSLVMKDAHADVSRLLEVIRHILPFNLKHNAEVNAVDLCVETSQLPLLLQDGMVDASTHSRVCLYLLKCADYLGDVDEAKETAHLAYQLYFK
ncbi:hypothetical protein EON67_10285, partial [archaeon]